MIETEIETETAAEMEVSQPAQGVAPAWHTAVLVAALFVLAARQAAEGAAALHAINRMATYAMAATMDLVFVAWVLLGLRLRRIPLREILGDFSFAPRAVLRDVGAAALFWVAALFVLGSCAATWANIEEMLTRGTHTFHSMQLGSVPPSQMEALQRLKELAPSNQSEIVAWIGLCLLVGFSEELIFRGYLQRQWIAALRGRVILGIVIAALLFGLGHVYQGMRGVFLISIFGMLFGALAAHRRSLRAGMIAHAWHDLIAGLALALLKSHHIL